MQRGGSHVTMPPGQAPFSNQQLFASQGSMHPRFAVPSSPLPRSPHGSPSAHPFRHPLGPSSSTPPRYPPVQQLPSNGYGGFRGFGGMPSHTGSPGYTSVMSGNTSTTLAVPSSRYGSASPYALTSIGGSADPSDTSGDGSSGSSSTAVASSSNTSTRGKPTGRGTTRGRGSRGGAASRNSRDPLVNTKWDQESLDVLIDWMTEGENYDRYRGSGDGNAGITKLVKLEVVVGRLKDKGIYHKDKHGIKKKVEELERSFRKAADWIANTGQGVMLQDGLLPSDEPTASFKDIVRTKCKEFYELEAVMTSRPSSSALLTNEDDAINVDSDTNEVQDQQSMFESSDDDFDLRDPQAILAGDTCSSSGERKVHGCGVKGKGKEKGGVASDSQKVDVKGKGKVVATVEERKGDIKGKGKAGEIVEDVKVDIKGKGKEGADKGKEGGGATGGMKKGKESIRPKQAPAASSASNIAIQLEKSNEVEGERLELEKKRQEREWMMESAREERAAKREMMESAREERAAKRERLEAQKLQLEIDRQEEGENSRQAILSLELEARRLQLREQRVEHQVRMIKKRRELEALGLSQEEVDDVMKLDQ